MTDKTTEEAPVLTAEMARRVAEFLEIYRLGDGPLLNALRNIASGLHVVLPAAAPTREPAKLLYGDRIKDNDPRVGYNRILTVTGSRDKPRVAAFDRHGRYFWISRARIYMDSKPRKSGFTLLPRTGAEYD